MLKLVSIEQLPHVNTAKPILIRSQICTRWWQENEIKWKPWYPEHTATWWLFWNQPKKTYTGFSCFWLTSYKTRTDFSYTWILATSLNNDGCNNVHTAFGEDGVFRFYIDTRKVRIYCSAPEHYVSRQYLLGMALIIHASFSAYTLLGTYLLTTYAHKHMRLITRVYGMLVLVWFAFQNVKGCRDGMPKSMQTRYGWYNSEGKFTKPYPYIFFTLVCNCNVKQCRDRTL